jgi:ATP-dependent DNA ligase
MWFPELYIVQRVWAVAKEANWSATSIYQFIWRMFATLANTKTTLEDVFSDLKDRVERDARNQSIDPQRVYFDVLNSKRLREHAGIEMMDLEKHELHVKDGLRLGATAFQSQKTGTQQHIKSQTMRLVAAELLRPDQVEELPLASCKESCAFETKAMFSLLFLSCQFLNFC